jgi:hypothetical protein
LAEFVAGWGRLTEARRRQLLADFRDARDRPPAADQQPPPADLVASLRRTKARCNQRRKKLG